MDSARKPAKKPAAKRRPSPARKIAAKKATVRKPAAKKPSSPARRIAGVGNDAVIKATGRAWAEWLKVLDGLGAKAMPHREIARLLARQFSVPAWWSQMVTVGYEQARGLRLPHQKADGFSANASKTIGASLDQLYAAWSDPKQRARWLPGAPLQVRRSTDGKSMRITWTLGPSNVDVGFFEKGPGRSAVQVEHSKLADEAAAVAQKDYWSRALTRLKALVEP